LTIPHIEAASYSIMDRRKRRFAQHIKANFATLGEFRMIRKCAYKLRGALQRAAARRAMLGEIFFGAIIGLVLIIILTFLGIFD
jgi:hypothetical protein